MPTILNPKTGKFTPLDDKPKGIAAGVTAEMAIFAPTISGMIKAYGVL